MLFTGIGVGSPEKHGHGLKDSHISYRIKSTMDGESFNVARRYNDFFELYQTLQQCLPSIVLPPLPEKQSITQLLGDRFSPQVIKRRQVGLARWLRRLAGHERAGRCGVFREFMCSSTAPDYSALLGADLRNTSSDSLCSSESQGEQLFSQAKEEIDLLNKHLKMLSKQSVSWNEHQRGIILVLLPI